MITYSKFIKALKNEGACDETINRIEDLGDFKLAWDSLGISDKDWYLRTFLDVSGPTDICRKEGGACTCEEALEREEFSFANVMKQTKEIMK